MQAIIVYFLNLLLIKHKHSPETSPKELYYKIFILNLDKAFIHNAINTILRLILHEQTVQEF